MSESKAKTETHLPTECERYAIIGNGFDLECGLPTKYTDYLKFLRTIEDLRDGKGFVDTTLHPELLTMLKRRTMSEKSDRPTTYEWAGTIGGFWYQHFREAQVRDGWVDFENEIARVIRVFEEHIRSDATHEVELEDYIQCDVSSRFCILFRNKVTGFEFKKTELLVNAASEALGLTSYQLGKPLHISTVETMHPKLRYQDLLDILMDDLDEFIRGFECYLREFVEKIEPKCTPSIDELIGRLSSDVPCRVLSFNYTSTLERMFKERGIPAEFCYVHGRIGDGSGKNRMVLGIDEHLPADELPQFIGLAAFRKYYQRIYKETDTSYMDWLEEMRNYNPSHDRRFLHVFGHSLGMTDRDILHQFLMAYGMHSTIYYHDEDMFKGQVANLTAIIGADEAIRSTGGRERSIRFVLQRKPEG